jgi:hypothetical protein
MEEYRIATSELRAGDFKFSETAVDSIKINHYPWDTNGYKPNAECKIVKCADGFKVRLETFEKEITATYTQMNDPVYKDSCLELFISPFQNDPDYYFNFELNPLGALLLGCGSKEQGRKRIILPNFKDYFQIESKINGEKDNQPGWFVEFVIPFKLLNEHQPEAGGVIGQQMKGNFYKCGDETKYPHYGCWSPIDVDPPSFHTPQFFGNLLIG